MYTPAHFALSDEQSWAGLERAGLVSLVAMGSSGLVGALVPVIVAAPGALHAHVARGNPFWSQAGEGASVLGVALFGDGYVSPRDYPSTRENPASVPTWNYVAVEVGGLLHVHQEDEWIERVTRDLARRFESSRTDAWSPDEAPEEYLERMRRGVVGIEVEVTRITGKAKYSQNRSEEDVAGMLGVQESGTLAQQAFAAEVKRWR